MRPILFEIGPLPIRAYGFMMMIGFIIGLYRAVRAAGKRGMDTSYVVDTALYALISGIAGARLFFILLNWPEFKGNLGSILSIWEGGLSFHGGVLFAVAAVYIYARSKRIPFMQIADLLAPSLAIGYAFARIGCFLNGCCYGIQTDLFFGVRFPDLYDLRHPTQLYASAASFLIYLALTRVEKWQMPQGYVFAAYLAMYSVYRFLIEFLRKGATAEVLAFGLTEAQIVSIAIFVVAGIALWRIKRKAGEH
ncbi:MAG: prolipoprotein diacylglyceryl transferase [Armatimonadota bacterium]|nr:prolipoprotein diacylglyceryl transferase [Armatimonadota bacterium]